MKIENLKLKIGAVITLLITIGALALTLAPDKSEAQVPVGMGAPVYSFAITNLPAQVNANMYTNLNTGQFQLQKGRGVSLMPSFAFTNGNAGTNIQIDFVGSQDGTNWTTSPIFSMTVAGNGSTGVIGYTNVPPTWLDNLRWCRVKGLTNQMTSTLFLTNVTAAFSN